MTELLRSFEPAWIVRILVRLLLTAVLTGAIGYERESVNQPAGFRTHTLVGIGACLVMLTAEFLGAAGGGGEPSQAELSRMGAAVISGIGFLGAGTILREGTSIRGLTTAASVWTVACIGLAVGAGFISGAVLMTVITVITLAFLIRFEPAQRSDEDCRRNGSRRRRRSGEQAQAGPGAADDAPSECLGIALDRDNHDILEIIRTLDRNDVPVQAIRVLDAGDPTGRSLNICLMTGPIDPMTRAGVIDLLLRDRRIIRILPDADSHP